MTGPAINTHRGLKADGVLMDFKFAYFLCLAMINRSDVSLVIITLE